MDPTTLIQKWMSYLRYDTAENIVLAVDQTQTGGGYSGPKLVEFTGNLDVIIDEFLTATPEAAIGV